MAALTRGRRSVLENLARNELWNQISLDSIEDMVLDLGSVPLVSMGDL